MIRHFVAILIGSLIFVTSAQVTVEPEITTDSVDILSQSQQMISKNSNGAMFSSLLLPGAGQLSMNRPRSALVYFTVDALSLFSLIYCESTSRHLSNNAMQYAAVNAGATGGKNIDERYWQAVGQFSDIDAYNNALELVRSPEQKFTGADQYWHWADDSFMEKYAKIREKSHTYHVAATFLAGALVLNRVVSFVELRANSRHRSNTMLSSISIKPSVAADLSKVSVDLSAHF